MSQELETTSLAVQLTDNALQALTEQRNQLKKFIKNQLTENSDFGIIPGTPKPTLYKPGAEKLANIFKLGSRIVKNEKEIDRKENYACVSITVEVYNLISGVAISTCEGIANSHESKNRYRTKYEWVNGKKIKVSEAETPIGDLLNTLSKMALKRAYVGAVIIATSASDFFTQDLEDMPDMNSEQKDTSPKDNPVVARTEKYDPAEFVLQLGENSKLTGTKLKDHSVDFLIKFIKGKRDYYTKEKKPVHPNVLAAENALSDYIEKLSLENNHTN